MKKSTLFILLFILLIVSVFITLFVSMKTIFAFEILNRPQNFVSDYGQILKLEEKDALEQKIANFEKQTTAEIAVVIISSLDGDVIENVAQDIFTKWGIGKKNKNNGVLVLVAFAEHQMRIQTGYGVEGDLTDIQTKRIQDQIMRPAFRAGDYAGGINGAVDKIIEVLNGNEITFVEYPKKNNFKVNLEFIFIIGFIILQWIGAILGRSKSWWGGGVLGAVIGGIVWFFGLFSLIPSIIFFLFFIIFGLGFDFLVSRAYQKAKDSGGHYPWWIGGGGSRGGGGFGGFGGGSSGGGGSSSSW